MKGFLLDTNIPSELIRVRPERRVLEWIHGADDEQLFLSVVTIGEISKGFTIHPHSKRRAQLQSTGWTIRCARGLRDGSSRLTSRLPSAGECSMANANCRERRLMLPMALLWRLPWNTT